MTTYDGREMQERSQLVGETIQWKVTGLFKPKWKLDHGSKTVASMISEKYLSRDFVGKYSSVPVRIEYKKKEDAAYFLEVSTNEVVGVIDNMMSHLWMDEQAKIASTFKCGGETYLIAYDMKLRESLGYLFSDPQGTVLAKTYFNRPVTPVESYFTLLSPEAPISPWLIALVSHYYAVNHAAGWI